MTKAPAALLAALVALAGCGGPEADTSAPVITFSSASGQAFFSTSSAVGASNRGCHGGLSAAYSAFPPGANFVHVRDGGATAQLQVTFADPAGIQRAFLQIPTGTLRSPATNKTVPIATAAGVSQVYEYNFFGSADAPQTAHRVTIDLTHGDGNRVFNVFAIDLADNQTETINVLVGEASNLCG
ncbi:MAG: hypothetical protein AAF281_06005 [Pseudomonadota bacterium]